MWGFCDSEYVKIMTRSPRSLVTFAASTQVFFIEGSRLVGYSYLLKDTGHDYPVALKTK